MGKSQDENWRANKNKERNMPRNDRCVSCPHWTMGQSSELPIHGFCALKGEYTLGQYGCEDHPHRNDIVVPRITRQKNKRTKGKQDESKPTT